MTTEIVLLWVAWAALVTAFVVLAVRVHVLEGQITRWETIGRFLSKVLMRYGQEVDRTMLKAIIEAGKEVGIEIGGAEKEE